MTDLRATAKIRAAFELSPTILSISDLEEGRLLEVNEAFLRITGFTRDEVIGKRITEIGFWIDPGQREAGLDVLRAGGSLRDLEARFRTKAGVEVVTLANADLVDVDGRMCVITSLMDITARVRAEAALRQSERAKDEFLAMLGHELRNPLGTITTTLGVMDRRIHDPELRRLTDIIGRQTGHLTRLVDDLLDVARVTSGKIEVRAETVDLHAVAARCLAALRASGRARDHDVVAISGAPVFVHADPARLEQIVRNLVDNALKYTPPGGQVRVTTRRDGDEAVLVVRDTGEGIREDLLPRIFDLFVQESQALDRARGGLGLGLSLVKRLAELHGGSVSAASAGPGTGSEFTVRLPVVSPPATLAEADVDAGISTGAPRRRVVIVEDNADARETLKMLLQVAGHEVDTAESAPAALEKLARFQPDVALIDIGLPGVDGYSLARSIREDGGRHLRLIALTGYGQLEDRQKALAAGFDVHVTKPVGLDQLRTLLG